MAATTAHDRVRRLQNTETALRLLAATGLLVDAAVHLHLAHHYDPLVAAAVSQGMLFRAEAAAATLAMAPVLIRRRAAGDLYALAVAAEGLAALPLHGCADIGTLGPLPGRYEPVWSTAKAFTACSQGIAAGRPPRAGGRSPAAPPVAADGRTGACRDCPCVSQQLPPSAAPWRARANSPGCGRWAERPSEPRVSGAWRALGIGAV